MAVDERSEVNLSTLKDVAVVTTFVGQIQAQHRTGFAWHSLDGGIRQEVQV